MNDRGERRSMVPRMRVWVWGAVLVTVTLAGLGLQSDVSAHPDDGTDEIDDIVKLTELTARANVAESTPKLDDWGGDTEYCVRVTIEHTGHPEVRSESFDCVDVNWDDCRTGTGGNTGIPCEEWEERDTGGGIAKMPLLPGPLGPGPWLGSNHARECTVSEFWKISVHLAEETPIVSKIISKVKKAFEDAKKNDPKLIEPRVGEKIAIAGELAGIIAPVLDDIFGPGAVNLGRGDISWHAGKGDKNEKNVPHDENGGNPVGAGVVDALVYFEFAGEKDVTDRGRKCPAPVRDEPKPCTDDDHPFSKTVPIADDSWSTLGGALRSIDSIAPETGETIPEATIEAKKQSIRELGAAIGQFIPQVAIEEAEAAPGSVTDDDLDAARQLKQQGDAKRDQAISQESTQLLVSALDDYRQSYRLLAPHLYPECQIVGGTFERRVESDSAADASGPSSPRDYAAPIAAAVGSALVLTLGAGTWYAWYARRRRLR